MGRVTITSEIGEGQYDFDLVEDNARAQARIAQIDAQLAQINDVDLLILQAELAEAQSKVDAEANKLDDAIADWVAASAWSAGTDYPLEDRVRIGNFATMLCEQPGRSGLSVPTWPDKHGDTVAENQVTWAMSVEDQLGGPSWSQNTDYVTNDKVIADANVIVEGQPKNIYATATTNGRSGFFAPFWTQTGSITEGGIIWRREDKADAVLSSSKRLRELAFLRDKAQTALNVLLSFKLSYEKEKAWIESHLPESVPIIAGWCADYTKELTGEVRSIEVNGEYEGGVSSGLNPPNNPVLIYPQSPPYTQLLARHNTERTALGLRPLYPDWRLYDAAERMAQDMADNEFVPSDHTGSDGSTHIERAQDAGYPTQTVLENIAGGSAGLLSSEDQVFDGWWASPGHKANIIDSRARHIGFSRKVGENGSHYWCAVFGWILSDQTKPERGTDGTLRHAVAMTGEECLYNLMVAPGWQKWMPQFRIGVLTAVDKVANTCDLTLIFAAARRYSDLPIQHNINETVNLAGVPVRYMTCNASAFEIGDRVIVEYAGQDRNYPYVVGFETNPKPCGFRIKVTRADGLLITPARLADDDLSFEIRLFNPDESFAFAGGYSAGDGYTGGLDASLYDNGYWLVVPGAGFTGQPIGPDYWIQVHIDDAITVQYPDHYKDADLWAEDNRHFPDQYDVSVPYWRFETVRTWEPESAPINGVVAYTARITHTVYSSVPYKVRYLLQGMQSRADYLGLAPTDTVLCNVAPDCSDLALWDDPQPREPDAEGVYGNPPGYASVGYYRSEIDPYFTRTILEIGDITVTDDVDNVVSGSTFVSDEHEHIHAGLIAGKNHFLDATWSGPGFVEAHVAASSQDPGTCSGQTVCTFDIQQWPLIQGGGVVPNRLNITLDYNNI